MTTPQDPGPPSPNDPWYSNVYESQIFRTAAAGATPEQAVEIQQAMFTGWFLETNKDGSPITPDQRSDARYELKRLTKQLEQQNTARGRPPVDADFDYQMWREDYETYKQQVGAV